jgi:hypothetical protein
MRKWISQPDQIERRIASRSRIGARRQCHGEAREQRGGGN